MANDSEIEVFEEFGPEQTKAEEVARMKELAPEIRRTVKLVFGDWGIEQLNQFWKENGYDNI